MLESPLSLGAVYFTAAFVFAIIYFMMWQINPDSFIVHEEMNLRPLRAFRKLRALLGVDRTVSSPVPTEIPLADIHSKYLELSTKEVSLSKSLAELKTAESAAKANLTAIGARHNAEFSSNIMRFLEKQQDDSRDRIQQALEDLRMKLAANPSDAELSRIKCEVDDKISALASQGGASPPLSEFTKTSALADLEAADNQHNKLVAESIDLSDRILLLKREQSELLDSWERQRRSRLGFLDFAYFSMGVATTNTFGDLIPNDRAIRFIIIAQLVISILLVGLFVNAVGNTVKTNSSIEQPVAG